MTRRRPISRAAWGDTAALIGKAHVAPAALGLDDDLRRDIQLAQTGKDSCRDMTVTELRRLLAHYETLGWKPKRPKAPPVHTVAPRLSPDQAAMIRGLWLTLRDLGALADDSPRALSRWIQRQTQRFVPQGIADLLWLEPEHAAAVINDLKGWVRRVEKEQGSGAGGQGPEEERR